MPLTPDQTLLLRAAMMKLQAAEKLVDVIIDLVAVAPPGVQAGFVARFRAEYTTWLNAVRGQYQEQIDKVDRAIRGEDLF